MPRSGRSSGSESRSSRSACRSATSTVATSTVVPRALRFWTKAVAPGSCAPLRPTRMSPAPRSAIHVATWRPSAPRPPVISTVPRASGGGVFPSGPALCRCATRRATRRRSFRRAICGSALWVATSWRSASRDASRPRSIIVRPSWGRSNIAVRPRPQRTAAAGSVASWASVCTAIVVIQTVRFGGWGCARRVLRSASASVARRRLVWGTDSPSRGSQTQSNPAGGGSLSRAEPRLATAVRLLPGSAAASVSARSEPGSPTTIQCSDDGM